MDGCQHWVCPTNSWGKMPKRKCDKQAVIIDANGRELCQHHYNRWERKVKKHNHSNNKETLSPTLQKKYDNLWNK